MIKNLCFSLRLYIVAEISYIQLLVMHVLIEALVLKMFCCLYITYS